MIQKYEEQKLKDDKDFVDKQIDSFQESANNEFKSYIDEYKQKSRFCQQVVLYYTKIL